MRLSSSLPARWSESLVCRGQVAPLTQRDHDRHLLPDKRQLLRQIETDFQVADAGLAADGPGEDGGGHGLRPGEALPEPLRAPAGVRDAVAQQHDRLALRPLASIASSTAAARSVAMPSACFVFSDLIVVGDDSPANSRRRTS